MCHASETSHASGSSLKIPINNLFVPAAGGGFTTIAGKENCVRFLSGAQKGGSFVALDGANPGYYILFLGGGAELYQSLEACPSGNVWAEEIRAAAGEVGQPPSATVCHPGLDGHRNSGDT